MNLLLPSWQPKAFFFQISPIICWSITLSNSKNSPLLLPNAQSSARILKRNRFISMISALKDWCYHGCWLIEILKQISGPLGSCCSRGRVAAVPEAIQAVSSRGTQLSSCSILRITERSPCLFVPTVLKVTQRALPVVVTQTHPYHWAGETRR